MGSSVSTLKPIVGMVCMPWFKCMRYRMVVLPTESRPRRRMRAGSLRNDSKMHVILDRIMPIIYHFLLEF
jgi:hypothetical protein